MPGQAEYEHREREGSTSPSDAAQQWMQYMQPFAGRATLVSPAITNGAPPTMGTGWLDSFLSECAALGCTVDAVAAHVYDLRAAAAQGFRTVYVRRPTEDAGERVRVRAKADGGEVDVVVDSFEELAALVARARAE